MLSKSLLSFMVFGLAAIQQAAAQTCSTQSTKITFYGAPDNDPPGPATAYTCAKVSSRKYTAGGTGSYADPLTFASAKGEFKDCEVIYAPYLKKYLIYQDFCAQCTTDWNSRIWHIDIWTGNSNNGGQAQIQCEYALTPDGNQSIVRNPPSNLEVDLNPTWSNGKCHTEHTYKNADASKSCTGGSGNGGSGSCSWAGHCAGAKCSTFDDCSDDLDCKNGVCASA